MEFGFNKELAPRNTLILDNIGEFAIEAITPEGSYFYLLIKTIMGQSIIATCGPVLPGVEFLPSSFSISILKTPYNEARLKKIIDLFLNDKYRRIVEANEIDIEDAIEEFKDVKDYLRNLSTESF